ncbi:hypothetical protein BHE74_00025308 [Ensete ventricosum]|nr:hypothetical protein BHE74_00025308 [Ensete ventricosum]
MANDKRTFLWIPRESTSRRNLHLGQGNRKPLFRSATLKRRGCSVPPPRPFAFQVPTKLPPIRLPLSKPKLYHPPSPRRSTPIPSSRFRSSKLRQQVGLGGQRRAGREVASAVATEGGRRCAGKRGRGGVSCAAGSGWGPHERGWGRDEKRYRRSVAVFSVNLLGAKKSYC